MTATELKNLVLLIGNSGWVRYWLHYSWPNRSPWLMAIECLDENMTSREMPELTARGFRYHCAESRGLHLIERTCENGEPFMGGGA